jgi:sodium/bile acid cotransporter 7
MFFATMGLLKITCRLLKFEIKDYKTALFCGSKKSLVHGTTMSKVLFSGSPYAGIYLLPIMIYHAGQLIIGGYIAEKMASNLLKSNS